MKVIYLIIIQLFLTLSVKNIYQKVNITMLIVLCRREWIMTSTTYSISFKGKCLKLKANQLNLRFIGKAFSVQRSTNN